jgi:ubiquinone biosynthesis protein UbiJ
VVTLLNTGLAAVIETSVNALLQKDPHLLKRLNTLASGKSVSVGYAPGRGLPVQQLTLIVTPTRLYVHSNAETADASISGSSRALLALISSDDPASALHHPEITLAGDIHLIQQLHREITQADTGVEDILADVFTPLTGDTLFALAAKAVRGGFNTIQQGSQQLRLGASDFLNEESGLLATHTEIRLSQERLDRLRLRLDRLQARIQLLQQSVTN